MILDNLLSCGMQEPSYEEMEIVVQNYVQSLIQEHPYWNRSQGADHFFVHCHESIDVPLLNNAIRVLCATQDVRQFNPSMDMFLPPLGYDIYPADFNLSSGYDFIDRYIAHIIKKKKKISFFKNTHVLSIVVSFGSSSATLKGCFFFPLGQLPHFFFFFFLCLAKISFPYWKIVGLCINWGIKSFSSTCFANFSWDIKV